MAQEHSADVFSFFTSLTPADGLINVVSSGLSAEKGTLRARNPNHFIVLSVVEAQGLISSFMKIGHLNGYGECCSYVIVRYGKEEKRTSLQSDTLHPKFNASFVFPHDPEVLHVWCDTDFNLSSPCVFIGG
jgi:hypothetical protein